MTRGWRTDRLLHGLQRRDPRDLASIALIAGLFAVAMLVVSDYGISNDEQVQHRYGEMILAYYASGFTDRALFDYKNLYLYGGLFDIVAVLLAKALPFDLFLIRHILTALTGLGGLIAVWATARLIAGARAGLIALAALAVCGPWFGTMFNHTKDIPFAAAMAGAVYVLIRAMRGLPAPRWNDILGLGILMGAAAGLRALGLLLIGYVFAAVAFAALQRAGSMREQARFAAQSLLRFMPAFAIGYLIMIAAWPWAALDILNPVRALFSFAHFHYEISTIVDGEIYKIGTVPWWYVPVYLAIKVPLLVFAGAACALICALRSSPALQWRMETAFIAFVALFPVLCEVVTAGPAFTGMRHFTFVLPPLAVLCGIGFHALLSSLEKWRWARDGAVAALSAALLWNAGLLVRLHPYEYLYYNQAVGGLDGAARHYEMDYWVNMMPEAVAALEDYLGPPSPASRQTYTVGVCGEKFSFDHYAGRRLTASPGWLEADFFIAPTQMNCDRLVDGRVIATIERLGVTIGVVKDRRGVTQKTLAQPF